MTPLDLLTETFPKFIACRDEGIASCTPYLTMVGGETWTAISNGVVAMAVPTAFVEERDDRIGKTLEFSANMRRTHVPFAELKAWALACGPYIVHGQCDECGGSGVVECNYGHAHDCAECKGEGTAAQTVPSIYGDDSACGTLSLVPLNRRLLGFLLRNLEASEVEVCTVGGPVDRVVIAADDWRVVIMPVRTDSPGKLPAFEATP